MIRGVFNIGIIGFFVWVLFMGYHALVIIKYDGAEQDAALDRVWIPLSEFLAAIFRFLMNLI